MILHNCKQNTEEWLKVRRGKFTASSAGELMAKVETRGYQNLINQVVFERLTDESPEAFESDYMKRGHELEEQARVAYTTLTFNHIEQIGFVEQNGWAGCSPDGLIGQDGILEIKCPKFSTVIDSLLSGKLPSEYRWQIQMQLFITGRAWVDFFSFHPKLEPMLLRVPIDPEMQNALEERLKDSIAEATSRISKIKSISLPK